VISTANLRITRLVKLQDLIKLDLAVPEQRAEAQDKHIFVTVCPDIVRDAAKIMEILAGYLLKSTRINIAVLNLVIPAFDMLFSGLGHRGFAASAIRSSYLITSRRIKPFSMSL